MQFLRILGGRCLYFTPCGARMECSGFGPWRAWHGAGLEGRRFRARACGQDAIRAHSGKRNRAIIGMGTAEEAARMSASLRERVIARLEAAGAAYRVLRHAPAVGSLRIAETRGMPASAGAKALLVRAAGAFVLLVLPGDRRLSSPKLRRALGTHDIRLARNDELLRATGCRPGEVPPFGELFGLPVVMDLRVAANREVAFTAGATDESFVMAAEDLVRIVQPRLDDLTCDEDEAPRAREDEAHRLRVREEFPALQTGVVFLENAGGSQVPACVSDAIRAYMRESYAQVGAGHPLSVKATGTVEAAHAFARMFGDAGDREAILGPSSTALLNMLAAAYARVLKPGQEIILAETGHEANLGPWKRLAGLGIVIRWWRMDPRTFACPLDSLVELLSPRTALVALPHVSNLVGSIVDLAQVVSEAQRVGAAVVADGVAYAPHRAIDVARWDVDWYVYSTYKVYGPHMAVLYGTRRALAALPGANHFFVPESDLVYKFEPGGPSHEACAGLLALGAYLNLVADGGEGIEPPAASPCDRAAAAPCERTTVERAFARMERWERPLIERLIRYLREAPGVRLIGPPHVDARRVGTISFVHETKSSREIAAAIDRTEIAIRHGHMYAWHLCRALDLDPADGVVRVSLVHYNTLEEIERLIEVLKSVL